MTEYKYNKYILILIVLGLLAGAFVSYERSNVEQANKSVDMIFEYEEILTLGGQAGKSVEESMRLFKEAGITSLAVYETTLEKLAAKGQINLFHGAELLRNNRYLIGQDQFWNDLVDSGKVVADAVYISGFKNQDLLEVEEDLIERFGQERVSVLKEDAPRILAVKGDYKSIVEQHLGILTSSLQEVKRHGFNVIARPTNYQGVTEENILSVFRRLENSGVKISGLLFTGPEVLGNPNHLEFVAQELNKRNWTLGMTEHPLQLQFDKQFGLVELGKLANYQVARLYVIDKVEQEKRLTVETAVRRWALTDEERNVRMNFIRAFKEVTPGKTLLETNLEYVSLIRDGVLKRGFSLAPAGIFEPYFPNKLLYIPLIFGAIAAGILYLSTLTDLLTGRRQLGLTAIVASWLCIILFLTDMVIIRQMIAFLAAVIFPTLAIVWQMQNWGKIQYKENYSMPRLVFDSTWQLGLTVLFSLIGGFYVSGILGDIRFLLEMDIYRGVKLTFLMPLILVTLVYIKRYNVLGEKLENNAGLIGQIKQLLNYPVYIKTILLLGIGAIVAYIFIGRTGHTAGIPVPGLEIKMRFFLEEVMYARPREKEFLVGHPSFYLAGLAIHRRWPHLLHYCLVMGATIGQGCLVETFAHMRTPFMMSLIRGIDGYLLGILMGILAVIGTLLLLAAGRFLVRRYASEE